MAPKAPAPKPKGQRPLTPAQNIARAQQAGLLPTPRKAKPKKVRTERGRKPRKPKTTTSGMVNKVRKLEQSSAIY